MWGWMEKESGIYWGEKQISKCPDMEINVPIRISLKDIEDDIFLGEKVKTTLLRQNVEEKLLGESDTKLVWERGDWNDFLFLEENGWQYGWFSQTTG